MKLTTRNTELEPGETVELDPEAGQLAYESRRLTAVEPSDEREQFVFVEVSRDGGGSFELPEGSVVVDATPKRQGRLTVYALIPREVYHAD
ncbi:MAG: hypothetical protein ABEJ89_07875 [Haloarculaceae archaeon]